MQREGYEKNLGNTPGYRSVDDTIQCTIDSYHDQGRIMTTGEQIMARSVFKDSIDYAKVRIHKGKFWLTICQQHDDTAMTPNGEIYFPDKTYRQDFSNPEDMFRRSLFIHEMTHVWQYQLGYHVAYNGIVQRPYLDYSYELAENRLFGYYNMEQQGNILADFYVLDYFKKAGYRAFDSSQTQYPIELYRKVLSQFFKDPKDSINFPARADYDGPPPAILY